MKQYILKKALDIVKKNNESISKDEMEKIAYGLEAIYLMIFKLIIIFTIAFILHIFPNAMLFFCCYGIIRTYASGLHAKSSISCFVISSILILGGTYLSLYLNIDYYLKIIIAIICIILIIKYAPADTAKRPLVNAKKRKKWKTLSTLLASIYLIMIIIFKTYFITNYLIWGLIFATIFILPITYKLFHLPYNNYKNYGLID